MLETGCLIRQPDIKIVSSFIHSDFCDCERLLPLLSDVIGFTCGLCCPAALRLTYSQRHCSAWLFNKTLRLPQKGREVSLSLLISYSLPFPLILLVHFIQICFRTALLGRSDLCGQLPMSCHFYSSYVRYIIAHSCRSMVLHIKNKNTG